MDHGCMLVLQGHCPLVFCQGAIFEKPGIFTSERGSEHRKVLQIILFPLHWAQELSKSPSSVSNGLSDLLWKQKLP